MEALPAMHDDNSGANPSSVKSDDSTPPHESGRGSPPPNCAICLGTCRNKSFTDSCLHQFCFKCLLTWSKVKAECPLCKQNFRSIIHNVRSNHQYEEYMVEQRHTEETVERIDIDNLTTATRRFRYRTTLTLPRSESLAIQQLLVAYPRIADALPPRPPPARRCRWPTSFRRTVYRHNLWARPLPDFTGRFRDCTPEFYRYNDSQMHRLVPWINRELHYLLNENVGHISYVMSRILELLPQYHITSPEFREAMQRYFGERTEHFLHELYCFASTPYDMTGYDRNVQYTTDSRILTMVNEVISSSDSEASVDSDIVMVSSSEPAEAPPGPSRVPVPSYPRHYIPPPAPPAPPHPGQVIPIETISHSDTDDDDSEVMVVGYIKPPQDRTPEVVDLLGSDSDVIVQETIPAEPTQGTSSERTGGFNALDYVKLSLKRHRKRSNNSDSDESYRPSPSPPRRRRRQRSSDAATTSDSCRTTPSPAPAVTSTPTPSPPPAPALHSPSYTPPTSPRPTLSAAPPNNGSIVSDNSATTSNSSRRKKTIRKKSKRKDRRDSNPDRTKKKSKKRSRSRSRRREKRNTASGDSERDRRSKQKSLCGKGVKSSKKSATESVPTPQHDGGVSEPPAPAPAAPGPSGSGSGTSSKHRHRSERDRERSRRRASRETKRLRSVVNVMYSNSKSSDSSPSRNSSAANSYDSPCSSTYLSIPNCGSAASEDSGRTISYETVPSVEGVGYAELPAGRQVGTEDFDSEDNLPLNLTVQKTYPFSEM